MMVGDNADEGGLVVGDKILLILVLLLALYGCTQLIRSAALRILTPHARDRGIRVLPVSGHRDDVEYLVRSAAVQRRWAGPLLRPERLILLDTGMDGETRELAEKLCAAFGVELLSLEAFKEMFPSGLQEADLSL